MSEKREQMRQRVREMNRLLGRAPELRDHDHKYNIGTLYVSSDGMSDSRPSLPLWSVKMVISPDGEDVVIDWLGEVTFAEFMERTQALLEQRHFLKEKTIIFLAEDVRTSSYELNRRELATVIAAVRHYEESVLPDWMQEIASDDGSFAPLGEEEIENLIQKLNQ